ncbi:MAG: DUF434 domain-containing protein [Thermodesulfobacteriota bacterium]
MPAPLAAAAADLRVLLGRGYPRERSLALVGDRHGLDASQRELLRRGVAAPAAAAARRAKLLGLDALVGRAVALDGHNLLITLETALMGGRLLWCDDGVVRDIARMGRRHRPGPLTLRAAGLLLAALAGAARVDVYLDAPLPKSGELAAELRGMLAGHGLMGDAQALAVPERALLVHAGPVASGDSHLIDHVAAPVDLAGLVIRGLDPRPNLESLV